MKNCENLHSKELKQWLEEQFDQDSYRQKIPMETSHELEKGLAEITVMDGVGAEKFAEHAWRYADELVRKLSGDRCWCESCECAEHGANSAIYTPWQVRKERFVDK